MGYGINKKMINQFIKEKKLNKNIKVINFQQNPYYFLKKADIFVLTSKFEGLPNVLLEAQTLKRFIISSDCPTGPKEILKNGNYGDLFNVVGYGNLSNKIILYNKNSKINRSKINLAYHNIERFDYRKNCQKYLSIIYKSL
jgi:glycosyltransferase involved in cell wall biosynthesis